MEISNFVLQFIREIADETLSLKVNADRKKSCESIEKEPEIQNQKCPLSISSVPYSRDHTSITSDYSMS
ncbi:unnamed protein product [Clavelina lepadiformis]|uniref:Uncharacterized protein n=1 Tax=Clavelina lepadiformis TaxID=159417 RepID=A0ABP0GFK9_CLALP